MSGSVPPTVDERDNLMKYLAQQRDAFRCLAHGLTDEQARSAPTVSTLTIGGLIKHVAQMERNWIAVAQGTPGEIDYADGFTMGERESLAELLADLAECGRETERIIADFELDTPVPVPPAPWFPKDVENWSVRWVLAHLIEEFARHAGHADIIREAIDGKTLYELEAMADGRHEEYLKMVASFESQ